MPLKNQMDHVKQDQGYQPEYVERRVSVPGLANLHELSAKEIGEVLATVIKSERNIVELRYRLQPTPSIVLVTAPDRPGYL